MKVTLSFQAMCVIVISIALGIGLFYALPDVGSVFNTSRAAEFDHVLERDVPVDFIPTRAEARRRDGWELYDQYPKSQDLPIYGTDPRVTLYFRKRR